MSLSSPQGTCAWGPSPHRRAPAPRLLLDQGEFDDPEELQLERTPNRHLSFGGGAHRCIGSLHTRVELRIAFEELHRRIPDYRIDPTEKSVTHPTQVRGVIKLPLLFTPEGRSLRSVRGGADPTDRSRHRSARGPWPHSGAAARAISPCPGNACFLFPSLIRRLLCLPRRTFPMRRSDVPPVRHRRLRTQLAVEVEVRRASLLHGGLYHAVEPCPAVQRPRRVSV